MRKGMNLLQIHGLQEIVPAQWIRYRLRSPPFGYLGSEALDERSLLASWTNTLKGGDCAHTHEKLSKFLSSLLRLSFYIRKLKSQLIGSTVKQEQHITLTSNFGKVSSTIKIKFNVTTIFNRGWAFGMVHIGVPSSSSYCTSDFSFLLMFTLESSR